MNLEVNIIDDAGYTLSKLCLVPYRGSRYHVKEWVRGNQRPLSKEELFNPRHSSLKKVAERILGILKNVHNEECPRRKNSSLLSGL